MEILKSHIVISIAGRDMNHHFFVLDVENGHALLADGKLRRLEKPKRKKLRHVKFVSDSDSHTALKIKSGEKITNSELRRALSEFNEQSVF